MSIVDRLIGYLGRYDRLRDHIKDWTLAPLWTALDDWRWIKVVLQARRWRRYLNESQIKRFDAALCPELTAAAAPPHRMFMGYPEAMYYIADADFLRAKGASIDSGWDAATAWGNYGRRATKEGEDYVYTE